MLQDSYVYPIENLAAKFRTLPGIGRKLSYRLAFAVSEKSDGEVKAFADALTDVKKKICRCGVCQNLSDAPVCPLCANVKRKKNLICVVKDPRDVASLLRIDDFDGVFHVLWGVISPLDGKTPDMLTIKELIARLHDLTASYPPEDIEVIVATDPTVEGDTTAVYLSGLIKPLGIRVTRPAYGIPVGAELEYADAVTLSRAFIGRNDF